MPHALKGRHHTIRHHKHYFTPMDFVSDRRNLAIYKMRAQEGLQSRRIAEKLGRTRQGVDQIFDKMTVMLDYVLHPESLRLLSRRALVAVCAFTKKEEPTVDDLRKMIKRLNETRGDWRDELMELKNCSKKTIAEIEEFAVSRGIKVD